MSERRLTQRLLHSSDVTFRGALHLGSGTHCGKDSSVDCTPALVSWGCRNKWPEKRGSLKQQKFIFSQVWRSEVRARCHRAKPPSEALREGRGQGGGDRPSLPLCLLVAPALFGLRPQCLSLPVCRWHVPSTLSLIRTPCPWI